MSFRLDLDPTTRHTIFSVLIGGVIRHTADVGLTQSIIQRYMALPSMSACLWATAIFVACTFFLNSVVCYCGFVAAAYYHDCDPISTGVSRVIRHLKERVPFGPHRVHSVCKKIDVKLV